jgi:hypothetical protein
VGACTVAAAVSAEPWAMNGVCMPAARASAIELLQQQHSTMVQQRTLCQSHDVCVCLRG